MACSRAGTLCVLSPAISFLHLAWVRTEWIGLPHPKSMCVHTLESQVTPALASYNGPWYHITAGHTNDVATGDTCAFLLLLLLLLPVAVVLRVLLTLLPDHGVVSHSWAECAGLGEGWSRLLLDGDMSRVSLGMCASARASCC